MAKDTDRSDAIEDSLGRVRQRMLYRDLQPCGACSWCSSYLGDNRLFCSRECSDDYDRMMRQKGETGQ